MQNKISAKEKAKEIYYEYLNAGKGFISEFFAQQCAILCCEVLIFSNLSKQYKKEFEYWQEVKNELKNILVTS